MSYYSYGRLKFCYQLLCFITTLGAIGLGIVAVTASSSNETSAILHACGSAVCVLLCALSVKRAEMYQTKMDNWSYKHYLDKNE